MELEDSMNSTRSSYDDDMSIEDNYDFDYQEPPKKRRKLAEQFGELTISDNSEFNL
jgi:hypothetical protein